MSITINDKDTNKIILIVKEGKQLTFTYDVPITTAEFDFIVKDLAGVTKITKSNIDFDTTDIAQQKVYLTLTTSDLDLDVGIYNAQLKTTWDVSTSVDKTEIIKIEIQESLFA
jgi:hypothetical protein